MAAFVVGTAGHVDHGKTALVRALTGVETDRWKEERERGLTIDLGFARLPLEGGMEASVVDVPGHEDFVKNMLAGATGIDLLLLVVAADEGPMPQTREHLSIARLLGIRHGVVAASKIDRVDEGWLELCREAIRGELEEVLGHADWPIHPVSAVTGDGVERLRAAISERAAMLAEADSGDLFRLPVDRAFSVPGAGTVATGTVWSGTLSVGDEVRVMPVGRRARVRSLQVHSSPRQSVGPRRRCAVAMVGLEPAQARRGSVVVTGAAWRQATRLGVRLAVLGHSPRRIEHGQRVRVYLGTREVLARVGLRAGRGGAGAVAPGSEAWAALDLEEGLVVRAGDRFVVRFYSPVTTIGGGVVAELEPPHRWLERTAEWARILGDGDAERLAGAVALRAGRGIAEADLPIEAGVLASRVLEVLEEGAAGVLRVGGRVFSSDVAEASRARFLEALDRLHRARPRAAAASREAVRSALAGDFSPELVDHALGELREAGLIVVEGPEVRLASHGARLTPSEARARVRLLEEIDGGGLQPPTVSELAIRLQVADELLHDLLRLLARDGELEGVNPDIYLSRRNAVRLRANAAAVFSERAVAAPTDFKAHFGVSRRYLIPLLEYLDRLQVTRRTSAGRIWIG